MSEEALSPEWCIVGNLLPYPYSPNGPWADFRSQKIFPAGAKLYVVGGFAGMAYDTITAIGYAHHRPHPVRAHIQAKYVGSWRARLVYRPVILRAIALAEQEDQGTCDRWLYEHREGGWVRRWQPADPAYGKHLAGIAARFQQRLHDPK